MAARAQFLVFPAVAGGNSALLKCQSETLSPDQQSGR